MMLETQPHKNVFRLVQSGQQSDTTPFLFNEVTIELTRKSEKLEIEKRKSAQLANLPFLWKYVQFLNYPIFDGGFERRFREYELRKIVCGEQANFSTQYDDIQDGSLYLFDLLVALEWCPTDRYISQLQRAFQRASDFLYDVTDGQMAFGQIIVGGLELMDSADIQIVASNRLYPRSWLNGLFDDEQQEHRPIRLGRGLWHQGYKTSIPWDEPEGYRTLVHEWVHYALGLHDEYLSPVKLNYNGSEQQIVIPSHRRDNHSVMASSIWSEMDSENKPAVVQKIQARFHNFEQRQLAGPTRLPLPLPRFQMVNIDRIKIEETNVLLPSTLGQDHYDRAWLYLWRKDKQRLLPQGTLEIVTADSKGQRKQCYPFATPPASNHAENGCDSSSTTKRFRLLGAEEGDLIVLIVERPGHKGLTVFQAEVCQREISAYGHLYDPDWQEETIEEPPVIAVVPTADKSKIRVDIIKGNAPEQLHLFPLGIEAAPKIEKIESSQNQDGYEFNVPTLDGHVLLQWGESDDKIMIYPFSQGGAGPGHDVVSNPPHTVGSADGNVMIFFGEAESNQEVNKDINVITTLTHAPADSPHTESYIYTIACSDTLAEHLKYSPTLVLYYDKPTQANYDRRPTLRRLDKEANKEPQKVNTYATYGRSFVAIPLTPDTAPQLFPEAPSDSPIQSYQLYWEPMGTT